MIRIILLFVLVAERAAAWLGTTPRVLVNTICGSYVVTVSVTVATVPGGINDASQLWVLSLILPLLILFTTPSRTINNNSNDRKDQ